MRACQLVSLCCLFLFLCVTATIQAQDGARIWVGVTGSYNTYSMSDLNARIKVVNTNTGFNLDDVKNGNAYGVLAGIRVNPQLDVFGGYERVTGSTEDADSIGSVKWDFPANAIYVGLQYNAWSRASLNVGFSGAVGIIAAAGKDIITPTGEATVSHKYSGSDLLAQVQVVGEYSIVNRVIFSPSIGYRFAKIGSVTSDEDFAYFEYGETKMNLDYSGLILRLTLKLMIF
jgi:hypothetical protein